MRDFHVDAGCDERASFSQSKKECDKPPKLIFQPYLSAEDAGKIKSSHLSGRVAMIVEEDGSVGAAKVMSADPKEGAQVCMMW